MNTQKILTSESFQKLIKLRSKTAWSLTFFLSFALMINVLLMSSWSELGSSTLFENGRVTVALAYSVGLILLSMLTCFVYVNWANNTLDSLIEQTKSEVTS